jgi:TatD DNase family protein
MEALRCDTEGQLLQKVIKVKWYPQAFSPTPLSFPQKLHMWLWEKYNCREKTPFPQLGISPPTSIACLLHHKILMMILPHVSSEAQDTIREGARSVMGTGSPFHRVFFTTDAHAHLDRWAAGNITGYEGSRWDSTIRLTHIISNFVYPASWHNIPEWLDNPRVYGTLGIHPNLCGDSLIVRSYTDDLLRLSEMPKIVGWGEIGLDYFRRSGRTYKVFQRRNLELLLQIRPKRLPIILHCREQVLGSNDALLDTLEILKKTTSRETPIMIHCFTGGPEEVKMFQEHFKEVYFSLGVLCLHQRDEQKEQLQAAIRHLDMEHILLETDAPYLAKRPRQVLSLIAAWIGEIKGVCGAIILEANRRNTATLFSLPPSADLGL